VLAPLLQPKADLVGDGLILADVCPRAYDKGIRERSDPAQVQNFNVGSFFILRGTDGCKPSRFFTIVDWSTGTIPRLLVLQKLAPAAIVL
jgi:hypothetical protein